MANDYGRFTWFELVTADVDKARAFYPETLPWKTAPGPIPGMDYTLFQQGESSVGGLMPPPVKGTPSHWLSYVSVEDVDATAKRVEKAGGSTLGDAFDIPNIGRMQPVSDPEGGVFCLFASADGDPPALDGAGSFHWNERSSKDPEALLPFYEKALGYKADAMDMPQGKYYLLKNGDKLRGGLMKTPPGASAGWMQYVSVDDVDATLERAKKNGATLHGDAMDVPGVGRFGSFTDPTGAAIAVIRPAPQSA